MLFRSVSQSRYATDGYEDKEVVVQETKKEDNKIKIVNEEVTPEGTVVNQHKNDKIDIQVQEEAEKPKEETKPQTKHDDLSSYSKDVRLRINELTGKMREAQRRERAALQYAKGLQKQVEEVKSRFPKIEESYLKEFEARVESDQAQATRELQSAIESQDAVAISKANQRLVQISIEKERLSNTKYMREQEAEKVKSVPKQEFSEDQIYANMLKTCVEGIIKTLPRSRFDLRIGLNAVSQSTLDFVTSLGDVVTKIYNHPENAKKYPVMREMFHDKNCPIKTPYLVWFDDDTKIVYPMWAMRLAEAIIANHREGSRLYGTKMYHDLRNMSLGGHRPELWFKNADWHRNVNLRLPNKQMLAANGSCIDFAVGYFWALATETMRQANIPDVRLNHNGGDITIGAQVHQVGGRIKEFNTGKQYIWCPTKEKGGRRGYSETFPWGRT